MPGAADERLHGVHGGVNAGRACWVVAGTFCEEKFRAHLLKNCETALSAIFFDLVRKEEGTNYQISLALLKKLKTIK